MSRKGYVNGERTIHYCSREQSGTGYLSIFIRENSNGVFRIKTG